MADFTDLRGKSAAILGLGRANLPLLDALAARGARLSVRDLRPPDALPLSPAALAARGIRLFCGKGYLDGLFEDYLFRAPGMRPDLPPLCEAVARDARLVSEYEMFAALCPAPLLGITGSDGKTTTTTLAGLFLREDGARRVFVGGNIGTPLLSLLPAITAEDVAVAELSSFQLMGNARAPTRAVITNISENHLDWHRNMAEYIAAKRRILSPDTHAVLNADNPVTAAIARERADKTLFSSRRSRTELHAAFGQAHTVTAEGGAVCYDDIPLFPVAALRLRGRHNLENCMAAIGLTYPLVRDKDAFHRVARSFGGVAHRLEQIGVARGVTYYNSSIDSTPTRTAAALAALGGTPILLCGGRGKGLSYTPLAEAVRGRVRALLLFGEARDEIACAMREAGVGYECFASMEEALDRAREIAAAGDCVLLSPACTSFDAYRNFEERGECFRRQVQGYIKEQET